VLVTAMAADWPPRSGLSQICWGCHVSCLGGRAASRSSACGRLGSSGRGLVLLAGQRGVMWSWTRVALRLHRLCSVVAGSLLTKPVRLLRRGFELSCPSGVCTTIVNFLRQTFFLPLKSPGEFHYCLLVLPLLDTGSEHLRELSLQDQRLVCSLSCTSSHSI
jgi:hypothetical protein